VSAADELERLEHPPDPWDEATASWLCDPPRRRHEVYLERSRSIVTTNDSDDVPFRYGANAYRGCSHACIYCYARPTHEHLGHDADHDFETKLVVKVDAPHLLARELASPKYAGEVLCISGATDPYQPLEASYRLTRAMLEVCVQRRQPVLLFTKGALVRRDADVLARLAEVAGVQVYVSIPFADPAVVRALEPSAPSPSARFDAMAALAAAGVPVGISLSPFVPGLSERDLPTLLERAARSGARRAFMGLVRLPGPVRAVFERRLAEGLPDAAARIRSALEDAGGFRAGRSAFGERMVGAGPRWELAQQLFRTFARRFGIEASERPEPHLPHARNRTRVEQGRLFDA
jgi:DNA repair photolyase